MIQSWEKFLVWISIFGAGPVMAGTAQQEAKLIADTKKITSEITSRGRPYRNLKELVRFGHRLSGSTGAAQAVEWAQSKLKSFGVDRVEMQPVMVPHWERGTREVASLNDHGEVISLNVTALGTSVGTGTTPIEERVVEVHSLKDVKKLGTDLHGKIVFYNKVMSKKIDPFLAYENGIELRASGAACAAKYGAKAVIVRSLTSLTEDDHPHTGMQTYQTGITPIPAVAISTYGAKILSKRLKKNSLLKVKLELSAQRFSDVESFNVIGEIAGRELPKEIVLVGGHLDSWDLGVGAQDDGVGVVQALEVIQAFKSIGYKPKRTVRVVLFMAEEFGGIGGREYAKQAKEKGEVHLAALESDQGGFAPVGFTSQNSQKALDVISGWGKYLAPVNAAKMTLGFAGTDIEPLMELGTSIFGFIPDSEHYFDYHHSGLDRLGAVLPDDLHQGAAAMAVFTYLLSEKGL